VDVIKGENGLTSISLIKQNNMAVSIDNVYQRVLTLANKEQRGYITPQEFNLLAYKAQMDIFESYFHEYGTEVIRPDVDTQIVTNDDILKQKLLIFRDSVVLSKNNLIDMPSLSGFSYGVDNIKVSGYVVPSNVYYLETVSNSLLSIANEVEYADFWRMLSVSKLRPFSVLKPVYCRGPIPGFNVRSTSVEGKDKPSVTTSTSVDSSSNSNLFISPGHGQDFGEGIVASDGIVLHYVRKPIKPNWAYIVVADKPLYNANFAVNFELHESEESTLTNKILELAGIVINKPALSELILRNEGMKNAVKNK